MDISCLCVQHRAQFLKQWETARLPTPLKLTYYQFVSSLFNPYMNRNVLTTICGFRVNLVARVRVRVRQQVKLRFWFWFPSCCMNKKHTADLASIKRQTHMLITD